MTIDLINVYYALKLDNKSQELTTITLPWGLYNYKRLPQGLIVSVDHFQKVEGLVQDVPNTKVYVDDIIILGRYTSQEYIKVVREVLERLEIKGLKVNYRKSFWEQEKFDYLGVHNHHKGSETTRQESKRNNQYQDTQDHEKVKRFIGCVNFYKRLIHNRDNIMEPITSLKNKGIKFSSKENVRKISEKFKTELKKISY